MTYPYELIREHFGDTQLIKHRDEIIIEFGEYPVGYLFENEENIVWKDNPRKANNVKITNGKITIYTNDANKNIFYQGNIYDIKDSFGSTTIKVRQQSNIIDDAYDYNNIVTNLST